MESLEQSRLVSVTLTPRPSGIHIKRRLTVQFVRRQIGFLVGVPFAVVYGIVARLAFGAGSTVEPFFAPLSVAFLFLVPIAVGALAVWLTPDERRTQWVPALGIAIAACAIAVVITGLLAIEALICILMATPILFGGSALGGAIACALIRRRAQNRATIIGLLIAPFLFAPIEGLIPLQDSYGSVETQIVIQADPATVWRTLIDVPDINPNERRYSLLFDLLGVPRPVRATLDTPGLAGMRRGWFEDQLLFEERIEQWQPEQRIAWAISVGDRSQVPAPWSEIGGRSFAVTGASYWIEPIDGQRVVLHLDSSYRLTTRFNGYGAGWVNWGVGEFQNEVLYVLKGRAEHNQGTH